MINIDLILIFLTLLIFFYTVEMICNYIVITRKKEEDNTIEGFDLDDITDSPLSMILIFVSSAAVSDEPIEDAYLDVSNYGIMATIVKNGKWGK